MKDIKKPTSLDSKSNRIPLIRRSASLREGASVNRRLSEHDRQISARVESFERDGDIYPQRRRNLVKEKKGWKLEVYAGVVLLVLAVTTYLLTYVFNSAVVSIIPRSVNINQNSLITLDNTQSPIFEFYELSEKSSADIKKSNSVDIKSKARGQITIYNNYDEKPQKLVKNTRLQTPDGKVFRLDNAIIIPGKSAGVAGSVKVAVHADTYGEEYNISSTQMSIPGFKGTAKYAGFYAKNDSNMTGGDMGKRYTISIQDLKDVEAKLIPELESKLREKILAYNDNNYIAVRDSLNFIYENNYDDLVKQSDLKVYEQKVTAKMVIIKKDEFAKRLARLQMSDYNGVDRVLINSISDLKVNIAPDSSVDSNKSLYKGLSSTTVSVATEYKGSLKWKIDTDNIKKELVGKSITDFSAIMGKYAGVDTAKPTLSPMWSHTFPNNINKIKVELE